MAKHIVKTIGWILVILGFIMRFTGSSFTGTHLDNENDWMNTTMDGKSVIFFGLFFLAAHYFDLFKKKNS